MLLPGSWPLDNPVGHDWFITGVDYPYIGTFGNDIGPNQILENGKDIGLTQFPKKLRTNFNATRLQDLRDDFNRLKSWGVNAVRMWAFEDGEGLTWRKTETGNWFVVKGIDRQFLNNIADIAQAAQIEGIRIYWCLLQSSNFDTDRYDDRPLKYQRMSRSFRYMLDNIAAVNSFLENALRPFIETLLRYPGGLFAIDLMNEPDGLWPLTDSNIREAINRTFFLRPFLQVFLNLLRGSRYYRRAYMSSEANFRLYENKVIDFLVRVAEFIKNHYSNVLVSTGFMYSNNFRRSENLARLNQYFDFFDFHFYDTIDVANLRPNLPRWNELHIDKPCILGECGLGGQIVMGILGWDFLGNDLRDWFRISQLSDLLPRYQPIGQFPIRTTLENVFIAQADFISYCLSTAHREQYAGCFIWEYGRQFCFVNSLERTPTETGICSSSQQQCRKRSCYPSERSYLQRNPCLDWGDRFPLLWKKREDSSVSANMCVHLRSSYLPEELCGRPVVRRIKQFALDLELAGLNPNY